MTLAPLASASDLAARGITDGRAATALEVASAAIRDAAGVPISVTTATVVVTGGPENVLTLPGPVRSVASVAVDGVTVTDFQRLPAGLWRSCGWGCEPVPVSVTFTFGLDAVPADVVDLCCQLAIAWLAHTSEGGGSTAGLKSVRIDDAAEAYSDEAAGQVSPVFIPEVTRQWLRSRFGSSAVVVGTL